MTRRGPLVVALDVGSSSVRAALYDARGVAPRGAFAQVRYEPDVDVHGGVSVPFDRLWRVVARALDALTARVAGDLDRVVGVGTSCFLHSLAGLDRDGRPVTPLLTWADTTSADAAAALRARLDAHATWQATGAPLHASYWPAKIVHLREATGDRIAAFRGAPELLWRSLTGRDGVDVSLASGTGLLDRRSGGWHAGLLAELRVGSEALPPILRSFDAAPLAGEAASRWPGLANVPWYAPWSDASCGNLGLGAGAGGPVALQVGTSGAMRVIVDGPVAGVPAGLFAHRLDDGHSLVGGQLSEGGGVLAAIAGLLGGTIRGLELEARSLPPGAHGLTILPFLAGERGPGYHERARGAIDGLSFATTRAEVYLATVESIALRFAAIDARLAGVAGAMRPVAASGGALARSPLLATAIAGALGRPIHVASEPEASARGAALRTLAAAGLVASPDAVPAPAGLPVAPEPDRVAAYRDALERQAWLYGRLIDGR